MMIKNIYLKVDTVGYYIFMNLLVNHIKNNSDKTAILFRFLFLLPRNKKLIFFAQ